MKGYFVTAEAWYQEVELRLTNKCVKPPPMVMNAHVMTMIAAR